MDIAISNSTDSNHEGLPWYRYGWPWFLLSIPLVSIILGGVMLKLALQTNNSMVVDDYYKQGKAINVRIERDRQASLLGLSARLESSGEGLIVQLSTSDVPVSENLADKQQSLQTTHSWPEYLSVRWVHVTQADKDGAARFQSIGGQRYIAPGVKLPQQGQFRLHVQPVDGVSWRLISPSMPFTSEQPVQIHSLPVDRVYNQNER